LVAKTCLPVRGRELVDDLLQQQAEGGAGLGGLAGFGRLGAGGPGMRRGSLAPAPVVLEHAPGDRAERLAELGGDAVLLHQRPKPREHVLVDVLPRLGPDVVRPDLEGDETGVTVVDGGGLALEVAELGGAGRPPSGEVTQDALGRRVLRAVVLVVAILLVLLGHGLPLVEVGSRPPGRGREQRQSRRDAPRTGKASLSGGADPPRLGTTVLRTRPAAPSSLRTAFGTRPAHLSIDRRAVGTRPAHLSIDRRAVGTRLEHLSIDRRAVGMRPADHAIDG
jgi:hypothetical protein